MKQQYGTASNIRYMIRTARNTYPSVLGVAALESLLGIALGILELTMLPVIVASLESGISLTLLSRIILGFGGAILLAHSLNKYLSELHLYGRIGVRISVLLAIQKKFLTTSYPNTENKEFIQRRETSIRSNASNQSASEAIWDLFVQCITGFSITAILLVLLTRLPLIIVAVTALTTIAGFLIGKPLNEWAYRHRDEDAEYIAQINYVNNLYRDRQHAKEIRLFGIRNWLEELYHRALMLSQSFHRRASRYRLTAGVIDIALTAVRNGVAYCYLIHLALERNLPTGEFLLYFSAVSMFTQHLIQSMQVFRELHKASLEISKVREYLDWPDLFDVSGRPIDELMDAVSNGEGLTIALEQVHFRYPEASEDTFSDLNLRIRPGEKIGIVGLNGAGKTTFIKLISGMLEPTEGRITVNGHDIREFDRNAYYRLFSAVFQEHSPIPGPLYLSISQSEEADLDRVRDCLDRADLGPKIDQLAEGIHTHIGREVYDDAIELSGGETQKLLLARALYKDAPILILDEPTAALDPIAESRIYEQYHALTEGKTALFISHRLASTRFCDRILLIGKQGILEEGTHNQLMQAGGDYAHLYQVQSQYYRKEEGDENQTTN